MIVVLIFGMIIAGILVMAQALGSPELLTAGATLGSLLGVYVVYLIIKGCGRFIGNIIFDGFLLLGKKEESLSLQKRCNAVGYCIMILVFIVIMILLYN